MKKIFFILTFFPFSFYLQAQEPTDALRYSWTTQGGTARSQSISGAIGALGGDITNVFVNPAGIGLYKTGDFIFTHGFHFLNNQSTYFENTENDTRGQVSLGTTGFVYGFSHDDNQKKLRGSAFSIAINRVANFNSDILYNGTQSKSSYSQRFLEELQNNDENDANNVALGSGNYALGTALAFNTYWIDTIGGGMPGTHQFQTRAPIATGLIQQNTINQKGGITELAIAGAANIDDKFYYGGTLGIPILKYKRKTEFIEADATKALNNFDYAAFSDNLITKGFGVNLKLGAIYKASKSLRLGLSFHSPTFYALQDKYTSSVTTDTENYKGALTQSSTDLDGGIIDFQYLLLTPYRMIASAAYVLGSVKDVTKQQGFITADIEYVNYKAMSYHTDPENEMNDNATKDYLKSINKTIDNTYKSAINIRLGGELKFNTVMVRLGSAYYGNPYKDINGETGNKMQLSGGLGYRNGGMFIDVSYIHSVQKDVTYGYRLEDKLLYKGASVKGTGSNVILTLGFKI